MAESISDAVSIGLPLLWKPGEGNRCGGGCNFICTGSESYTDDEERVK